MNYTYRNQNENRAYSGRAFTALTPGRLLAAVILLVMMAGCSSTKPYTLGPVKTFDPDNRDIPQPAESEEYFTWETFYLSTFYQLEKPLDLGNTFRAAGHLMGLNEGDEAENVNVLDEVPNSSWYTRRHYFDPMSIEELTEGPNAAAGPDTTQNITVIRGKSEGITPGFTIRDAEGDTYIIKLDGQKTPEAKSSSEVIGTLIFYASGYHTPQNTISYFDPDQLVIGEEATMTREGGRSPMTQADLDSIIHYSYKRPDGKMRVLASKYVEGRPLGPWDFMGTRKDDPNDRIPHQDRRELRGLRILASWLNDTDRRSGNTLASYVEEDGRRYVRHYLIDMGSTLGTHGLALSQTKRGLEYRYDPRYMMLQYITLGLYVKPWELPSAADRPHYPSLGYYEHTLFDPGSWVPNYPNAAFEQVTARDGFWGAKMVMAFSDEEIEAIVKEGELSDRQAEAYLIEVMKERRDKIGRYWFRQVNPIDKFRVRAENGDVTLEFADLGVEGGLFSEGASSYRYRWGSADRWYRQERTSSAPKLTLDVSALSEDSAELPRVLKVRIHTLRNGEAYPDKHTDVYLDWNNGNARVIGIERED